MRFHNKYKHTKNSGFGPLFLYFCSRSGIEMPKWDVNDSFIFLDYQNISWFLLHTHRLMRSERSGLESPSVR